MLATWDCDSTCVVGPMAKALSLIALLGSCPRWKESGSRAMCTVCAVVIARRSPFGETDSCRIGSPSAIERI